MGVATCRNLHMLVLCLQNQRSEALDDPLAAGEEWSRHPTRNWIPSMAATQRAVQVVTVAHPVALSARSLVFGRERLAQARPGHVGAVRLGARIRCQRERPVRGVRRHGTRLDRGLVSPARPRRVSPRARRTPRPPRPGRHARHGSRDRLRRPAAHGCRASPARRRLPGRLPRGRRLGRAPASHADDRAPASGTGPGRR